jgi:hypothetical protein
MSDIPESQGDRSSEQRNFSPNLNPTELLQQRGPVDQVKESPLVPKFEASYMQTKRWSAEPSAALQHEASTMNFNSAKSKLSTKV